MSGANAVPDAGELAQLLARIEALEAARREELALVERLRALLDEQGEILRALGVQARGAS